MSSARNGKKRPFVVCHMLTSLDGKIDGDFFSAPQTAPALRLYGELSLVIAPMADGNTTSVSIFEQSAFMPCGKSAAFRLKGAKEMDGNVLWLRYEAVRA